jgi:hypothetical protein
VDARQLRPTSAIAWAERGRDRPGSVSGPQQVTGAGIRVSMAAVSERALKPSILKTSQRWRAFADIVALALGINVWVSIVLLPSLFVGRWASPGNALPLLMLVLGLWRRSELVLLLLYPAALLVPVGFAPELASAHVYGPARFVIVGVGLIAYLLGISFFASFYEPPPPESSRPLASSRRPQPSRWQRRYRLYWALTILSVVFPATMFYAANFDEATQAFLRQMYPGRTQQMLAVIDLVLIAAWMLIYGRFFVGLLRLHRTGDPELARRITRIRAEMLGEGRRRPRVAFFIGVICAVGFMLLFLFARNLL